MHAPIRRTLAASAAVALVLGGCGGDDAEQTPEAEFDPTTDGVEDDDTTSPSDGAEDGTEGGTPPETGEDEGATDGTDDAGELGE
ncbi:MAG: hypothetical protein WEB09_10085 [Nitriliruptor sp.]